MLFSNLHFFPWVTLYNTISAISNYRPADKELLWTTSVFGITP